MRMDCRVAVRQPRPCLEAGKIEESWDYLNLTNSKPVPKDLSFPLQVVPLQVVAPALFWAQHEFPGVEFR